MVGGDAIHDDAVAICDRLDISKLAGRSLIVTGCSGLVGSYVLAVVARAAAVSGKRPRVYACMKHRPPAHLIPFLQATDAQILEGDLTDSTYVASLPSADLIVHAAGYGQPGMFMADPRKTLALNTQATFGLLARLAPGGQFLFVSTSEIYSGAKDLPYTEKTIGATGPDHPRACYIEGKRCGEAICNAHRTAGVDAKSARLALAYGPGTKRDDKRVLNTFIQRALTEGRISLQDQGLAKRTYGYVADAVEILLRILLDGREAVYNVGGKSRTTVRELAESVGRIAGVPVELPPVKEQISGAPDDVWLDMTLVEREFGKTGYVGLDEGLTRTVAWQRGLYGC